MAKTRRAYTGGAVSTTTTSAINASGTTSFTITAYTGWPYGSDPFYIVVEPGTASEEKILVTRTGVSDTTINIASDSDRGLDGTAAVSHGSGVTVFPVFTAVDADEANELASKWSAKGDLVSYGSSTFEKLGVGTNGQVLVADSGETSGLKWSTSLSGLAVDTDTLYVDATNDRVGINDATPSYSLDVDGDINATGDVRVAGNPVGMVRLFEGSMSGTTYSISNVFSSAFRNYHINISNLGINTSTTRVMYVRFRTASDDTTSSYAYSQYGHYGTTAFNDGAAGQTLANICSLSDLSRASVSFDVLNPNVAAYTGYGGTFITYQSDVTAPVLRTSRGSVATTTQYTGISFILSTSTFSSDSIVTIYGYGQP